MSKTQPKMLEILAVLPPDADPALLASLQAVANVQFVANSADALAALKSKTYQLVITDPLQLSGLAAAAGQQRSEAILERIGQGVCILNRNGQITWMNPKLRSYPSDVIEAVRETCARLLNEFITERARPGPPRARRRAVNVGHEFYFDLTASPLGQSEDQIDEVVALVWDLSATRRLQEKINAIDAAGRELVRLDAEALAQMDVPERLRLLEDKIIRFTRDLMHFNHFTVRVLDKSTNRLETVLAGGFSEEAKSLDIYATADGNGISGYVAATGRSYICADIAKDPRYLPGLETAKSSLTVPLRLHDQIVGILNVESDEVGAFNEDDRQFAEIFGRYIAIALNILRLLAVERHTTTGQIAADVAAEIALPLNDIITEATNLIEDNIGHDDLRKRLHTIIDNVDRVKRSLQSVTAVRGAGGLANDRNDLDPQIQNKRILIADDEEIIRETINDVLTKAGAITVMARDGEEAISLIKAQHFDLVLSDIKMPNRNGYEVFAAAREANPGGAIILITGFGYDPNHSIVRASKEGLSAVLFKPFKVEQLLEHVRKALIPAH